MPSLKLGKATFDLPDAIAGGDVAKALKEAASALADYAKTGKSEKFRALMEKIIKTGIPNDLKKAKDDKDAKSALDEVKKTIEKYTKAIDTPGQAGGGPK